MVGSIKHRVQLSMIIWFSDRIKCIWLVVISNSILHSGSPLECETNSAVYVVCVNWIGEKMIEKIKNDKRTINDKKIIDDGNMLQMAKKGDK